MFDKLPESGIFSLAAFVLVSPKGNQMKDLKEGESIFVQGSGKKPYEIKKIGGVVSCSCPAWRNLGGPIDTRVCKHIKANVNSGSLLPQATKTLNTSVAPTPKEKKDAPELLLAHTWTDEDPTGWWISQKLDGVRALWDGEKFISRLGNVYHAPFWFKEEIPNGIKLDGELFAGHKKFDQTVGTVKKLIPNDDEWKLIVFNVFDAPDLNVIFESRISFLNKLFKDRPSKFWKVLDQIKCEGADHVLKELAKVEKLGVEGLMLRAPNSMYESGRSSTLLKVKSFFDAEATVVGIEPGKGKHKDRMGALICETNEGVEFKVGSGFSDKERENPPKIGDIITFKYQELTKAKVPRFPTFWRTTK